MFHLRHVDPIIIPVRPDPLDSRGRARQRAERPASASSSDILNGSGEPRVTSPLHLRRLQQDRISLGNLGTADLKNLTTSNADLEIRLLFGSISELFQKKGDDDETPAFGRPSGSGLGHRLLAGLCRDLSMAL